MFAGAGLAEKRVEAVVATVDGLVRRHLPVRLDAVLQAVQLPAGIANLHSGLADVDWDAFTLQKKHEKNEYFIMEKRYKFFCEKKKRKKNNGLKMSITGH